MATLRAFLAAEPFALALSSGFFGFFAHAGFVRALEEEGLRPTALHGSSAGALVGACWAAGLSAEEIAETLLALERAHFWDPAPGAGLLRGALFRERLESLLPVARFEECPTPLAISVFDLLGGRTRVLRRGPLVPAVYASCAVPFMFHPHLEGGRPLWDGGILDRPGLEGVPQGARVLYHHLASRSPWRRASSPALRVPDRSNLAAVVLTGLPRVGPFRLPRGAEAYRLAREATKRALDRELDGRAVTLAVDEAARSAARLDNFAKNNPNSAA
jgi:NTE family protein